MADALHSFHEFISGTSMDVVWSGLKTTLFITVAGMLLGTLLAAALCAASRSRCRILQAAEQIYSVIIRGIPVLMLLLFLFYVAFARSGLSALTVAVIAFALNSAAHVDEIMKSALSTVDEGQVKAARTLGFSRWQAFRYVTLPQAFAVARPVYQSAVINTLQWTSVVGYITISDLTRVINQLGTRASKPFFSLFLGVVIYLLIGYLIHLIFWLPTRKGGDNQ
ncbi:MAG: ABC transporter permease subunit [Oscillospiraceae bacterium]|nr:ABC transporter permease subunit [Oscillospiraceae bacterium]